MRKFKILFILILLIVAACENKVNSPDFNWDGLLTDEELNTPVDSLAPPENPVWSEWIAENNDPIRSLTSENFSDLRFLDDYIGNKRIVMMGENVFGCSEYQQLKTRLIKYLHQELDFDVIVFESSIYECFLTNQNKNNLTAFEMMQRSIYPVWWSEECQELFQYIKETSSTTDPLEFAGCDIQTSSNESIQDRPIFLHDVIDIIDEDLADDVFLWDNDLTQAMMNFGNGNYQLLMLTYSDTLQAVYEQAYFLVQNNMTSLQQHFSDNQIIPLIAERTLFSLYYMMSLSNGTQLPGLLMGEVREYGMAKNLECIMEELYPDKNIIFWGKNFHLRKDQMTVISPHLFESPFRSMGTWIEQLYPDDVYAIAFHIYTGEAQSYYNSPPLIVPTVESGSLESIFYRTRRKYCYLDISGKENNSGSSWLYEYISAPLCQDDTGHFSTLI